MRKKPVTVSRPLQSSKPNERRKARLAAISSIVARSYPGNFIGIDNQLPWNLPTDLKHFKKTTNGKALIMGRKTFQSIGRPLPNRYNVVLSRELGQDKSNLIWADSVESALYFADIYSICNKLNEIFVIGGSQMYSLFHDSISKVYLTQVFSEYVKGDSKFEFTFDNEIWRTLREEEFSANNVDQFSFRISVFRKRISKVREEFIDKFLDPDGEKRIWRARALEAAGNISLQTFSDAAEQLALDLVGPEGQF